MTVANLSAPICVSSDQTFALSVNVATGDAYSNTPATLSSGDGWAQQAGSSSAIGVPVAVNGGTLTATFNPILLADLVGSTPVVLRWVDRNGSPGQLRFVLQVTRGLAPSSGSPSSSGQTINIYVAATAACCVEVVMYPAGPAGPGAAVAASVALSAGAIAALAALNVSATSVDAAIIALAALVVSGASPGGGTADPSGGGTSDMSVAGNASQTTIL